MKKVFFVLGITLIVISSCKKEAGEGGQATITGKIWARNVRPDFGALYNQGPGADIDVYIIYGDDATYGNRVKSGPDGVYEFDYLRKGNYKIYAYSKDSVATVATPPYSPSNPDLHAPNKAIIKSVEITSKKQTVDAGTIVIEN